jgi:hypothetical protein
MLEIFPPPEHLAVDKVIVVFTRRIISNSTYPRNTEIKMYKLCDMPGYTHNIDDYLQKARMRASARLTAKHITTKQVTKNEE